MAKLNIRKGDKVLVISGKYRDVKTPREVLSVFPGDNKVIVEGVNVVKDTPSRQQRAQDSSAAISEKTMPIHASNVALIDPKSGKPTRIRRTKGTDGKVQRVAVKSGEPIA